MTLLLIILGGLLSIAYGLWAINDVMKRDAGTQRMQEIAGAIAEGAQAYLRRQYTTIAIVGIVLFVIIAYLPRRPRRGRLCASARSFRALRASSG